MRAGRLCRIASKELVEILRDRRTIITLLLMPLLVYPLLGVVVQKLMLQSAAKNEQVIYRICFENEKTADEFSRIISLGEILLMGTDRSDESQESAGNAIPRLAVEADKPGFVSIIAEDGTVLEYVESGQADVGVVQRASARSGPGFELIHVENSGFSRTAMKKLGQRIRLGNDEQLDRWLKTTIGQNPAPATYIESAIRDQETGPPALLTFVPLMLVLMTITGAVYPAIDLTAGERERGTMEILVAAPISRVVLLFGKFVAVLTVAMLTALANLVAMVVTIYALGLDDVIFSQSGVTVWTLVVIFLLLLVLAAFFSATLLGLTSIARSFKEAQAYLIPLMLVAFAPGLLSLSPNLETSIVLAIIPLVNVVMVGRDLLAGNANTVLVVVAFISTALYGAVALAVAARIFGADSVFAGEQSSWQGLFARTKQPERFPSMTTALSFLALLFPFFVVASGLVSNLATRFELPITQRLIANALITFVSFVCLPLVFAGLSGVLNRFAFFLHWPRATGWIAAVLLGLSVWTLVYEIEVISLSTERASELIEFFSSLKVGFNEIPLVVKLSCLAIVPAVCEEFTFRGFLLSGFRQKMSPVASVIMTALLFGLFHVFVRDNLFLERMIPSTLMGLLLGAICLRTGSILPGMLLHVVHNGLLITLSHYEQHLQQWGIGVEEQSHLPLGWILIALVPIAIGITLLFFSKPVQDTEADVCDQPKVDEIS